MNVHSAFFKETLSVSIIFCLSIFVLFGCQSTKTVPAAPVAELPTESNEGAKDSSGEEPFSLEKQVEDYRLRYNLKNVFDKLVDNRGNGYSNLYGVRNFRVVLHGVYYRGGANNKFHSQDPRHNENPLPNDGLENLCEEGFAQSVYLYDTNFQTAPKQTNCLNSKNQNQTLYYTQLSAFKSANTEPFLKIIFEHIKGVRLGPVYAHCWNGWHASGLLAALSLRQFCGWTAEAAVSYWDKNTDGNNKEPSYEKIRKRIRDFKPLKQFQISAEEQRIICP